LNQAIFLKLNPKILGLILDLMELDLFQLILTKILIFILKTIAIVHLHKPRVGQMLFFIQVGLKNHLLMKCNLENLYYPYYLFPSSNEY
jgi:hypothetical protein